MVFVTLLGLVQRSWRLRTCFKSQPNAALQILYSEADAFAFYLFSKNSVKTC